MSASDTDDGTTDEKGSDDAAASSGVPTLAAAFDDPDDPTEVTLFPAHLEDPRTCWLSADVDTAVSLDAAA